MSTDYNSLPNYSQPDERQHVPNVTTGTQMSTAKEQAPLMKLMGKMLSPKMKSPRLKGNISPQSVKLGHKKKSQPMIKYW